MHFFLHESGASVFFHYHSLGNLLYDVYLKATSLSTKT